MTTRPGGMVPSADERVADYVRSRMRVEFPPTLVDDVVRSVADVPQHRQTWFGAFGPATPAIAGVALTLLIIAVGLFLATPRNVGPPPDPTPTPEPTLTPVEARVLTEPGAVIRIPALDGEGQFGTITIERGEERGSYPDYVPLMAMLEEEVFFVELYLTYEVDRHTADPYGANDFAFAVDANENGFDERDVIKQWIGFDVDGSELEGGPEPSLPFMGFGDVPISGWIVAELPAAGATFDIHLIQVVDARADEPAPGGQLEPLASVLLREPGEPVGVTTFDPSLLPEPSGSPVPLPSRYALPTPPPSPAATFEPMADAEADALFEETRRCTNTEVGFTVAFPASWETNDAFEDIPACSWFDPEPIDTQQVFEGLAAAPQVFMTERPDYLAGIEEPTFERLPIAGRVAWRVTFRPDQLSGGTAYLFPLGDDQYGPFLSASAGQDEGRAVLERMLLALEFTE